MAPLSRRSESCGSRSTRFSTSRFNWLSTMTAIPICSASCFSPLLISAIWSFVVAFFSVLVEHQHLQALDLAGLGADLADGQAAVIVDEQGQIQGFVHCGGEEAPVAILQPPSLQTLVVDVPQLGEDAARHLADRHFLRQHQRRQTVGGGAQGDGARRAALAYARPRRDAVHPAGLQAATEDSIERREAGAPSRLDVVLEQLVDAVYRVTHQRSDGSRRLAHLQPLQARERGADAVELVGGGAFSPGDRAGLVGSRNQCPLRRLLGDVAGVASGIRRAGHALRQRIEV